MENEDKVIQNKQKSKLKKKTKIAIAIGSITLVGTIVLTMVLYKSNHKVEQPIPEQPKSDTLEENVPVEKPVITKPNGDKVIIDDVGKNQEKPSQGDDLQIPSTPIEKPVIKEEPVKPSAPVSQPNKPVVPTTPVKEDPSIKLQNQARSLVATMRNNLNSCKANIEKTRERIYSNIAKLKDIYNALNQKYQNIQAILSDAQTLIDNESDSTLKQKLIEEKRKIQKEADDLKKVMDDISKKMELLQVTCDQLDTAKIGAKIDSLEKAIPQVKTENDLLPYSNLALEIEGLTKKVDTCYQDSKDAIIMYEGLTGDAYETSARGSYDIMVNMVKNHKENSNSSSSNEPSRPSKPSIDEDHTTDGNGNIDDEMNSTEDALPEPPETGENLESEETDLGTISSDEGLEESVLTEAYVKTFTLSYYL